VVPPVVAAEHGVVREEEAMTNTLPGRPSPVRTIGFAWLALSALAIAVFAPLRYFLNSLPDLAATGEEIATHYVARPGWAQTALLLHAGGGGLALLLSPVQLSARVRAHIPRVHRVVGRTALLAIAVGGVAGLVLSTVSLAGPIGTAGFGTLAVAWLACAALGLRAILRGDVAAHRRWMLRTFALTYAGVTLRLWLIVLIPLLGDDFLRAYLFTPFLCWVPNLVIAELLLRRTRTAI
jgi:uncharacterized membrane protein